MTSENTVNTSATASTQRLRMRSRNSLAATVRIGVSSITCSKRKDRRTCLRARAPAGAGLAHMIEVGVREVAGGIEDRAPLARARLVAAVSLIDRLPVIGVDEQHRLASDGDRRPVPLRFEREVANVVGDRVETPRASRARAR